METIKKIGVTLHVDSKGGVNMSLDIPSEGLPPGQYSGTIDAVVVDDVLRLGDRVRFKNTPKTDDMTSRQSREYSLRQVNEGTVVDIGVNDKLGYYVVEWDGPFRTHVNGEDDLVNRTVMVNKKQLELIEEDE